MAATSSTMAGATSSTMAGATSSTMAASSSSVFSSNSAVTILNQSLLLLSNMANMMTKKLDNTNYIVWRHQMTMVLEMYSLFELIKEPQLILDQYLKDLLGSYTMIVNPEFLIWKSKEKVLLTFLSSTLTPSILARTVGCSSALEVWKVLENRFSSISRSHVMNLKEEESLNDGSEIKDTIFAMAATSTPKPNNNGFNLQ
nr:hypothetical protein CFP56_39825 [Quercus suber]